MIDFSSVDMRPSIAGINEPNYSGDYSSSGDGIVNVAIVKGGATPKEEYEIKNTLRVFFDEIHSLESIEKGLHVNLKHKTFIYIIDVCHITEPSKIIDYVKYFIENSPSTKSGLIVIGHKDSINLYSQLRGIGAVYATLESFSIVLKDYSANNFASLIHISSSLNVCTGIMVIGAAGGVGTSTFCREYAKYLSDSQRGRVCLVEKDVYYSSQMMLNNIADKTQVLLSNISMPIRVQYLESITHELAENLYLFSPRGESFDSKNISDELENLILSSYRFVVSDYSIHAFAINKENVSNYQNILLITNGNISSFKNTSEIISELNSRGIPSSKITLIFNNGTAITDFKAGVDIYKKSFPECEILVFPKIKDMNIYVIDGQFAFKNNKQMSSLLSSLYQVKMTPANKQSFSFRSLFGNVR